jgi:hypothetical protein
MGLNWWQEKTIEHGVSIDVLNAQMLTANETVAILQPLISANTTAISSLQASVSANTTAISTLNTDLTDMLQEIPSLSLTNHVVNGDFSSGVVTPFTLSGCTAVVSNNTLISTITAAPGKVIQATSKACTAGHIIYVTGEATVNGPNCTKISLYLWNTNFAGATKIFYVNNPVQGRKYKLGGYFIIPSDWTGNIRVSVQYDFSDTGASVQVLNSNMLSIDLTDGFGADKELSHDLDTILSQYDNNFFSGTVNTPVVNSTNTPKKDTVVDQVAQLWTDDLLSKGFDTTLAKVFNKMFGSIFTEGMYIAHCGAQSRWNKSNFLNGGHVFEGFSKDKTHRATILVVNDSTADKMYRSAIQDFDIANGVYGWLQVGTDDPTKGWEFTKDMARANVPLYFKAATLPTKMPGKDAGGADIPLADGIVGFDGTNFKARVGGVWKTFTLV